jgi:hypothetical protein
LALGKRKALVLFTGKMGGGKGFYFSNQGQWVQNNSLSL